MPIGDLDVPVIDREWDSPSTAQGRCQSAWGRCAAHANIGDAKGGITDMCEDKACSPEDSLEIRRQVQALDAASAANRLREEKTYEDHGRNVLNLFHGPSLRAMLTTIAAGRRTGERRVADPSTAHVLGGGGRVQTGGGRHVLSA